MQINFILVLLFSVMGLATQANASTLVLRSGSEFYLYSFVEAGLEQQAALATRPYADRWGLIPRLAAMLHGDQPTAEAIAMKLYQISERNLHLAVKIRDNFFAKTNILLVNQELVKDSEIGDTALVPVDPQSLFQSSILSRGQLWIDRQIWEAMSLSNRAGLIINEALRVVLPWDMPNATARTITARLFSPAFEYESPQNIYKFLVSFMDHQIFENYGPLLNQEDAEILNVEKSEDAYLDLLKPYVEKRKVIMQMVVDWATREYRRKAEQLKCNVLQRREYFTWEMELFGSLPNTVPNLFMKKGIPVGVYCTQERKILSDKEYWFDIQIPFEQIVKSVDYDDAAFNKLVVPLKKAFYNKKASANQQEDLRILGQRIF